MVFAFEVKRFKDSETQGKAQIFIDGKKVADFGDEYEIRDGRWRSKYSDEYLIQCYFNNVFSISEKTTDFPTLYLKRPCMFLDFITDPVSQVSPVDPTSVPAH